MDLLALLDELRIIGQNGKQYADDPHDEERYERLLELAAEWYGHALDLPPAEVRDRFAEELGHVTPKIGGDAAVFDDEGRLLVQRRADDGTWGLPGGFVDPNESPRETAVRETREETGLAVEPEELIGVYTRKPGEYGPHGLVIHIYRCTRVGGEIETSPETEAVEYRRIDEVDDWHRNHGTMAGEAVEYWEPG